MLRHETPWDLGELGQTSLPGIQFSIFYMQFAINHVIVYHIISQHTISHSKVQEAITRSACYSLHIGEPKRIGVANFLANCE